MKKLVMKKYYTKTGVIYQVCKHTFHLNLNNSLFHRYVSESLGTITGIVYNSVFNLCIALHFTTTMSALYFGINKESILLSSQS